jgi:dCTP diphosphatase
MGVPARRVSAESTTAVSRTPFRSATRRSNSSRPSLYRVLRTGLPPRDRKSTVCAPSVDSTSKSASRGSVPTKSCTSVNLRQRSGYRQGVTVLLVSAPDRDSPTLADLQEAVRGFRDERDWRQFHTLKDLAAALAVEAGELQEQLLWVRPEDERERLEARRSEIEAELADVVILALSFADVATIDLAQAVRAKLVENARRYPPDEVRGTAVKYSERTGDQA